MSDEVTRAQQEVDRAEKARNKAVAAETEARTKSLLEQLQAIKALQAAEVSYNEALLERAKAQEKASPGTMTAEIARLTREIENYEEELVRATIALENFNTSMSSGAAFGNQFAQSLGIVDSQLGSFFEKMSDGTLDLRGYTEGIKSSFNATKIASSILNTYIDANLELFDTVQKVNSQLNKSFTPEYANRIINSTNSIEVSLRKYNIGYDESAAAIETLNNEMSDFSDLSEDQIKSLGTDSALMTKFGISNEEYAETIQDMTKGFGESVESAQENMREMRNFSGAIGKSTKEVMADFNKVKGFLAQYGSNYENIFRRMETITRKTGVAIEDLQAIAQGFDQFEDAATSVGKLNALLGGPFLNTIDMLNTEDPAEQILKLKQAFDSAGKSVNSMSRRELQAFAANIPGINGDITKMKKLFGQLDEGILDSADSVNEFLEGSSDSTSMMEKQAQATMTLSDSMQAIQKMMAENGPAIMSLVTGLQTMVQTIIGIGENIRYVMFDIGKLFTKFSFLKKIGSIFVEAGDMADGFFAKLGKHFGVGFLKKIPGLGILLSAVSAASRAMNGDYLGAAAELASGALSTLPGLGTAASMGVDAILLASDVSGGKVQDNAAKFVGIGGEEAEPTEMAVGGVVTREINNVTIGERGREAVIPLEDGKDYLTDPLAKAVRQVGSTGGGTPNINLTVMLEGKELRAFVKNVIAENLNPLR
jgi:methyl-accepting chemotaxis protein